MTTDFNPELDYITTWLAYRCDRRDFILKAFCKTGGIQTVEVMEMGSEGGLLRRASFNPPLALDTLTELGRTVIADTLTIEAKRERDDNEELS